ncbi:AEC family transporter [uncultured Piscinibacter sp.]|uniref:AEC family transporter n=1 Tax=uncultured Piscinibacter sp. TaxID=1131835 RepID=UPI00261D085D|nr:AEC family transporter [uncultured Piscinibacter sp.]
MLDIFAVTAPFFGLVLAGWAATRLRWMPLESIPGLNGFVLFFALPCMLFRFAASTPIAKLMDAGVVSLYLLSAGVMVALSVATTRRRVGGWNDASFGALVAAFPNSGFIGVPLLVALLGERAAAPAIVALAIDMVATSSLCIALSRLGAAGSQGAAHAVAGALRGMVSNPLPWAIVLGSLSSASSLQAPPAVMGVVELLAGAASPVALFALGGVLARAQMSTQRSAMPGGVAQVVAYKLLVHPLLVLALGRLAIALGLPLDPFAATVLVLVAALPSASNVPMLAERFRADAGRLARIVLFSTAGAFLSFSAAVALLASR